MSHEGRVLTAEEIDASGRYISKRLAEVDPPELYAIADEFNYIVTIRSLQGVIAERDARIEELEAENARMRPVVNSLSSDPPEGATEGLRASADIVARTGAYSLAAWLNAIADALEAYNRG